jgi:hypothetical protein
MEALRQAVGAVLGAGDLDIPGEFFVEQEQGAAIGVHGLVEAGDEEAGFEGSGAEQGVLGEGQAFEGEEFLGVGGLVDGEEVGFEVFDGLEFLDAEDGEGGGGEAVLAGVEGGAGFTFGGAGAGGLGCVGAVGGELLGGDGVTATWHKLTLR